MKQSKNRVIENLQQTIIDNKEKAKQDLIRENSQTPYCFSKERQWSDSYKQKATGSRNLKKRAGAIGPNPFEATKRGRRTSTQEAY